MIVPLTRSYLTASGARRKSPLILRSSNSTAGDKRDSQTVPSPLIDADSVNIGLME